MLPTFDQDELTLSISPLRQVGIVSSHFFRQRKDVGGVAAAPFFLSCWGRLLVVIGRLRWRVGSVRPVTDRKPRAQFRDGSIVQRASGVAEATVLRSGHQIQHRSRQAEALGAGSGRFRLVHPTNGPTLQLLRRSMAVSGGNPIVATRRTGYRLMAPGSAAPRGRRSDRS